MADAPDIFGLLKNRAVLQPRSAIENIAAVMREQSKAIIDSPAPARGINDEKLSVAAQDLRPFADRHTEPFPGLVRCGDQHARPANRERIAHRCDVKILLAVAPARPTRPNQIKSPLRFPIRAKRRSLLPLPLGGEGWGEGE